MVNNCLSRIISLKLFIPKIYHYTLALRYTFGVRFLRMRESGAVISRVIVYFISL